MKMLRYSFALTLSFLIPASGWSDDRASRQALAEQIVDTQEAPGRIFHPEFRRRAVTALLERPAGELKTAAENLTIAPLALGDSAGDMVYTRLDQPCRVIDTRLAGGLLTSTRDFKVAGTADFELQGGTPGGCGIPLGPATAVMINFIAVNATGAGNLRGAAWSNAVPTVGSIINYQNLSPVLNVANGVVFPICDSTTDTCATGSDLTLLPNGGGVHVVADVLGYYTSFPLPTAGVDSVPQTQGNLLYTTLQQPCRIVDTRLGGGALSPGAPFDFKVAGSGDMSEQGGPLTGCGVPEGATVAMLNIVAVNPAGGGNLLGSAYPSPIPGTGSIINYQKLTPNLNIANGLLFPICDATEDTCTSDIRLQANVSSVHLVIDVLGWASPFLPGVAGPPETQRYLTYTTFPFPCRILDTRAPTAGGRLISEVPRNFKVKGATAFDIQGGTAGGCGIPDDATVAMINFIAVSPTAGGNLKGSAFPNAIPITGSVINYQLLSPPLNIANGLLFPVCDGTPVTCTSDITLQANQGAVHVVADVIGYARRTANLPPTDIALSDSSIDENQTAGTAVGTFTTTDPDPGDTHTYTLVAGPGDTDNASFQIVGNELQSNATFNFETKSSYTIRVRSTDAGSLFVEKSFVITIGDVNDAPVAVNDSYSTPENTALVVPDPGVLGNDTDEDLDTLTATLITAPTHGSLAPLIVGGTFAGFTYTPDEDYFGPDSFTYRVNDGTVDSATDALVSIDVISGNEPPVGNPDNGTVAEGGTLNVPAPGVLANDTDSDGPSIQAILVSGPAHASSFTLNADGSYTYTHNGSETTTDSFVYKPNDTISDGNNTTVTITITPLNDAPVAVADSYSTDEDTLLSEPAPGVLGNDTDADNPTINAILVSGPTHAAPGFTLNPDGSFSYMPVADYSGPDSFQYKANDGLLDSNTVTVTIMVNAIDDTPTDIALSNATIAENQPSGTPVGTFTTIDPDGTPHTYTLVSGAGDTDNASFQIVGDQLRSAATFDFETKSSYTIRVRSTDSTTPTGLFFEEQFTITVTNANEDPTDIALSNASVNENMVAGTPVGNFSTTDPDAGDTFTYTLVAGAGSTGNGSFQISGNVLQTAGPLNFEATPSLSIRIRSTDAGGLFFEEVFIITVNDVNEPPVADDDTYNNVIGNTQHRADGGAAGSISLAFHTSAENPLSGDTDPDTNPAFNALSVQPVVNANTNQGGKITIDANGKFTYNPPTGFTGSDFFDYTLTDGANTDLGRLNFTVANMVWYVKNDDEVAPFLGTSTDPFNELSDGSSDAAADDAEDASTNATPSTVYVFKGDGTNVGMNSGIALDINQKLIGEVFDLVINGVTLVTGNAANRPVIGNSGGDGVGIVANATTDNSIKGFSISGGGGAGNGIDLTTTAGTVDLTVDDVIITTSVQEGIDINVGGGTVTVNLSTLNVTAGTTGIDMTVTSGTGRIATFSNITISGNTTGSGIIMNGVRFDTDADGGNDPVVTGPLNIGAVGNGVGVAGAVLNTMTGGLNISSIISVSDSGAAFHLSASSPFDLTIGSGILDANAGGPGLSLNTVAATISNLEVDSSNSSSNGITLTNVTGNVTLTNASHIENSGTADFNISGGSANVTYNGTITDDLGQLVRIVNTTGGTKLFTGAITDNFDGDGGIGGEGSIHLSTNGGATITFSGGLSVSTATNAAFNATGGGTITVTDPVGPAANKLATTTGTALNISSTTIGASNVTFESISANGAANGIFLNNTGASGGLKVTGDSGSAVNSSGGTIQNTTSHGISLTSTQNPSLDQMNIQNTANDGINGTTVTNFTFTNSTMAGAGDGANEFGTFITNLFGTNTFDNVSVTNSQTNNLKISNNSSTVGTLTITNSTFTTTDPTNGGDAVNVETGLGGAQVGNLTVNLAGNNDLNNSQGDGIQAGANDNSTLRITVDGSNSNFNGNLGSAVNIAAEGNAQMFALVQNLSNVSTGTNGVNGLNVINIQTIESAVGGTDAPTLHATVQNNTITSLGNGTQNASGIRVIMEGRGTLNAKITGNTINNLAANGIVAQARAGNGVLNLIIGGVLIADRNTISLTNAVSLDGISIEAGSSAGGDLNTIRLNMQNNISSTGAQQGYRLRKRDTPTFELQDFIDDGNGADDVATDVPAWVNTVKANSGTTDIVLGLGRFTATSGVVVTPTLP